MSLRAAVLRRRGKLPSNGKMIRAGLNRLRGDCFVAPLLAMTLALSACLPLAATVPTVIPLPSNTAAPTGTIVWFPATATATLGALSTALPTAEMNPGIGDVTLSDDFTDEKLWDTAVSDQGSAAIANHRLALAVQPGVYLVSMRHNLTVGDFYAEITARPSLCRGEDSYGIILRVIGKASFYRFLLNCNSEISAERVSGGVKLTMQEPVPSGDAPRPPGEVHIGIWAVGSEMRLFLNGRYQFSISDKQFPSGGFGVFTRASGDEMMSVTFYDFKVYEVNYTLPTKTPLP